MCVCSQKNTYVQNRYKELVSCWVRCIKIVLGGGGQDASFNATLAIQSVTRSRQSCGETSACPLGTSLRPYPSPYFTPNSPLAMSFNIRSVPQPQPLASNLWTMHDGSAGVLQRKTRPSPLRVWVRPLTAPSGRKFFVCVRVCVCVKLFDFLFAVELILLYVLKT